VKIQKNKIIFILTIFILILATWGANKFISNQYELKFTDSQEKNGSFVLQSGKYKISYYSEQYGILTIEDNSGQSLKQQTYQIFLKPNTANEIIIRINNSKLRFENNGIFISEQFLDESIKLKHDLKVLNNNIKNLVYEPKLSFTLDNNVYVFFLIIIFILIVNFLIIWSKAYLKSRIILIILTIFIGSLLYFVKNYYNLSYLEYYSTNHITSQQNPFKYTDTASRRIVFRSELSIDDKSQEGLNYFGLKNLTPLPNNKLLLTIPLLNNKFLTTSIDKVSTSSNSLVTIKNSKNFLHISVDGISKKSLDLKNERIDYSKLIGDSFNKSVVYELSVYKWNYGFRIINLMILTTFFNLLLLIIFMKALRLKEYIIAENNIGFVSIIMISVNLFNFIIEQEILVPKMPTLRVLELLSIHNSNIQMKIFNNQTILNNLSTDFPYLDKTLNIIELNLLTLFFTILILKYTSRIRTLNITSFVERTITVLAIILIYFIDILKNTNMIIVLFSLCCAFLYRTQLASHWLKLVILVFTLTLFYPGFLLLPLILINQRNLKLIIKIYTALFTLILTLYLSASVNVFNSQFLIDLTNNSKLAFGPLLIIALGLLFVAFRKSESYDFIKTEQVILIGIVLFISANGSILINVLSLIILISSPKIFEGNRAGIVR
jgi:hypothetical protein